MACDWLRVSRLYCDCRRNLFDERLGGGWRPGCLVDGSDHECRWEPTLSRRSFSNGRLLDSARCSWPKGQRETDGANRGPALLRGDHRREFTWHVERLYARGERSGPSTMTDRLGRLLLDARRHTKSSARLPAAVFHRGAHAADSGLAVVLSVSCAEGRVDRLPELAAAENSSGCGRSARAAKQATATIPHCHDDRG